jgi:hypothetical protein
MMDQKEREQHVNAYVSRKLAEMAEEREGDLRVSVAGLVNSEVTFDIREFQGGEWKVIHEGVSQRVVRQATQGCFICRNQSLICGDYRRHEPVVVLRVPCVQCVREYSFPKRSPSQLAVNGYCSVPCAIAAGVAPAEAVRQAQEHMVYIGE